MSAAELKIPSEAGYQGLITFLGMLERGEVPHWKSQSDAKVKLNMAAWISNDEWLGCGTVCCIGGAVEYLTGVYLLSEAHVPLEELFYPFTTGLDGHPKVDQFSVGRYLSITPEQAARALRSYLTTGHPRWSEVLQDA